jgi:T5SS/PEP-CTERM-associated repeat protein/autotransporter-associated beta strand protein
MSASKKITARHCFAADPNAAGRLCHRRSKRAEFLATVSLSALCLVMIAPTPAAAQVSSWSGATNSDWTVGSNWNGGVPTSSSTVNISTVTPNPTVIGVSGATSASVVIVNIGAASASTGSLTIQKGSTLTTAPGTFTNGDMIVGAGTSAVATLTVTGAGSNYTTSSNSTPQDPNAPFVVSGGTGSQGTVTVSDGGAINLTGTIGRNRALPETLIGLAGSGVMNITSGGTFTSTGGSEIGVGVSGQGNSAVTVDGTGSKWTMAGKLIVGDAGTGALTISNNGAVSVGGNTSLGFFALGGGNGTLTVESGGTFTSSSGAQIGDGAGTTNSIATVTGAGSQWTVTGGGLTIGNAGAGTLNINNSGVVTASSGVTVASQAGSFGTLNLAGGILVTSSLAAGSGSPFVNFNGGTLQATGNNAAFISGFSGTQLNIQAGGATIDTGAFNVGTDSTSAFTGVGGLTKIGSGTLDLTGTNSYTGATNIDAGTLRVDGSIGSSSLTTVAPGAVLTGIGTVGNTTVQGTFAPGNGNPPTPGTSMTVAGNLTFTPGSHYVVSASGSSASFANVTGTATLTGGTVDAFVTLATTDQQHLILQSNGRSTTFSGVVVEDPNFMGQLVYIGNNVYLVLKADLGGNGGTGGGGTGGGGSSLSGDDARVAGAIDNFFNSGGKLPLDFAVLFEVTGSALANDLSELDGEAATGAERAAFQLTNQFLNVMLDPFVYGRSGGGGGAIGFAPEQQDNLPPDVARAYASILKAPAPATFDQRWTAWGGMSTRQAAARFAIGIATAGTWARL